MDNHGSSDLFGPKPHSDEGLEAWLITYADGITLILLFFLLLLSSAKFDVGKYDTMSQGIMRDIAGKAAQSPMQLLKFELQDTLFSMQADQVAKVSSDEKGVVVEFSSAAFFKPGSAEIHDQAVPLLKKLTESLKQPRYDTNLLEVEGHTDDIPIQTDKFPSNWELSGARAASMIRLFIGEGMAPDRFMMAGFADTKPKAPNRDGAGNPVPENQALNRRVTMHITRMSLEEQARREKEKKAAETVRSTGPVAPSQSTPGQGQGTASGILPSQGPGQQPINSPGGKN